MSGRSLLVTALVCFQAYFGCSQLTTDLCGITKTCYRNPENCSVSTPECRFVSWQESTAGDGYLFELSGGTGNGEQYVAMALGTKNEMADADLYYCDGLATRSGVISEHHEDPMTSETKIGNGSTVNGVAQCTFIRSRSAKKVVSDGELHDFDIVKNTYWLLMAVGDVYEGEIDYHDYRRVSTKKYNFSAPPLDVAVRAGSKTTADNTSSTTQAVFNATITATTTNTTSSSTSSGLFISANGCDSFKKCVRIPDGCQPSDVACRFFSWKKSGEVYEFEMSGAAGAGREYIAMALGTVPKMQDADLYYCDGHALRSGVITIQHREPTYLDLQTGLVSKSAATVNGVAQCVFTRAQSLTKNISTGPHEFDIKASKYYLLGAIGQTKENGIKQHTWQTWTQAYDFSSSRRIDSSTLLLASTALFTWIFGCLKWSIFD